MSTESKVHPLVVMPFLAVERNSLLQPHKSNDFGGEGADASLVKLSRVFFKKLWVARALIVIVALTLTSDL